MHNPPPPPGTLELTPDRARSPRFAPPGIDDHSQSPPLLREVKNRTSFTGTETDEESWEDGFDFTNRSELRRASAVLSNPSVDDMDEENWDAELGLGNGLGDDDASSFTTIQRAELFKAPTGPADGSRPRVSLLQELKTGTGLSEIAQDAGAWPQDLDDMKGSAAPRGLASAGSFVEWAEALQEGMAKDVEQAGPVDEISSPRHAFASDVFGQFEYSLGHAEVLMNISKVDAACVLLGSAFTGFVRSFDEAPHSCMRLPIKDDAIVSLFERSMFVICRIADRVMGIQNGEARPRRRNLSTTAASGVQSNQSQRSVGSAKSSASSQNGTSAGPEQENSDLGKRVNDAIEAAKLTMSRVASVSDKFGDLRGPHFGNELRVVRFELDVHLTQIGFHRRRFGCTAMRNMLLIAELCNPSLADRASGPRRSSSQSSGTKSSRSQKRSEDRVSVGVRAMCNAVLFTRQLSCITFERIETHAARMVLFDWADDSDTEDDSGEALPTYPDVSTLLREESSDSRLSDSFPGAKAGASLAQALMAFFRRFSREWLFHQIPHLDGKLRITAAYVCGLIFHQPIPFFGDAGNGSSGPSSPRLSRHGSEKAISPRSNAFSITSSVKSLLKSFESAGGGSIPSSPSTKERGVADQGDLPDTWGRRHKGRNGKDTPTPLSWALQYDVAASALAESLFFECVRLLEEQDYDYPPDFPSPDSRRRRRSTEKTEVRRIRRVSIFHPLFSRFAVELFKSFAAALRANGKPRIAVRMLEAASFVLGYQKREKYEASMLRDLVILCATCGESVKAVKHFKGVLTKAIQNNDVNEVGFLIELGIPMRVEIGDFGDALADLNEAIVFLEGLGILEASRKDKGHHKLPSLLHGGSSTTQAPSLPPAFNVNQRAARSLLESFLYRKALVLFSLHSPSDAAEVLLALLKVLNETHQSSTTVSAETLRKKRECVLSWLAKAYYKTGRHYLCMYTIETLMAARSDAALDLSGSNGEAASSRLGSRGLFRMGAGFSRHTSSGEINDCLLQFAFEGIPIDDTEGALGSAAGARDHKSFLGVHLDCAELYSKALHKLSVEGESDNGKNHIGALRILAPAVIAVELYAHSLGDKDASREVMLELGRLYYLRAKIQASLGHNPLVRYPVTVAREYSADDIDPPDDEEDLASPHRHSEPLMPSPRSERRRSSTQDSEDPASFFAPSYRSAAHADGSLKRSRSGRGRRPSGTSAAAAAAAAAPAEDGKLPEEKDAGRRMSVRSNLKTHYRKYRCPEDFIWDALRWYKYAWDCFKTTKDYVSASKCAAAIAEVHLDRLFLNVTVGNLPVDEAGLLPRRTVARHTTLSLGSHHDPVTFASAADFAGLTDGDLRPKVNQRAGGDKAPDSAHKDLRARKLNVEDAVSAAKIALNTASELLNPFKLIHANALMAQAALLQGNEIDALGYFWEARDLFLHFFADGPTLPSLRFRSQAFHHKFDALLKHLLRFLVAVEAPVINQNLLLIDIKNLESVEKLRCNREIFRQIASRRQEVQESLQGSLSSHPVHAEINPQLVEALGLHSPRRRGSETRGRNSFSEHGELSVSPRSTTPVRRRSQTESSSGVVPSPSRVQDLIFMYPRLERQRQAARTMARPGGHALDFGLGVGFELEMQPAPRSSSLVAPNSASPTTGSSFKAFPHELAPQFGVTRNKSQTLPVKDKAEPRARRGLQDLFNPPAASGQAHKHRVSAPAFPFTQIDGSVEGQRSGKDFTDELFDSANNSSNAEGASTQTGQSAVEASDLSTKLESLSTAVPEKPISAVSMQSDDQMAVKQVFECLRRFSYVNKAHSKGRYNLETARFRNRGAMHQLSLLMRQYRRGSDQPSAAEITYDEIRSDARDLDIESSPRHLDSASASPGAQGGGGSPLAVLHSAASFLERASSGSTAAHKSPSSPQPPSQPKTPAGADFEDRLDSLASRRDGCEEHTAEALLKRVVYVQLVDSHLFLFCPETGKKVLQRYHCSQDSSYVPTRPDRHRSSKTLARGGIHAATHADVLHPDTPASEEKRLDFDDSTITWLAQRASADPKGSLPFRKKHRRSEKGFKAKQLRAKQIHMHLSPSPSLRFELESLLVDNNLVWDEHPAEDPAESTQTAKSWSHPKLERTMRGPMRRVHTFLSGGYAEPVRSEAPGSRRSTPRMGAKPRDLEAADASLKISPIPDSGIHEVMDGKLDLMTPVEVSSSDASPAPRFFGREKRMVGLRLSHVASLTNPEEDGLNGPSLVRSRSEESTVTLAPRRTAVPMHLIVDDAISHIPWEMLCSDEAPVQRAPTILGLVTKIHQQREQSSRLSSLSSLNPALACVGWDTSLRTTFGYRREDRKALVWQSFSTRESDGLDFGFGSGVGEHVDIMTAAFRKRRRRSSLFSGRTREPLAPDFVRNHNHNDRIRSMPSGAGGDANHRRSTSALDAIVDLVPKSKVLSGISLSLGYGRSQVEPVDSERVLEAARRAQESEARSWPMLSSNLSVWPAHNLAIPSGHRALSFGGFCGVPGICRSKFYRDFRVFEVGRESTPQELIQWCDSISSSRQPLLLLLSMEDLCAKSDAFLRLLSMYTHTITLLCAPRAVLPSLTEELSRVTRQFRAMQTEYSRKKLSMRLTLRSSSRSLQTPPRWNDAVQSLALHYRSVWKVPIVIYGL